MTIIILKRLEKFWAKTLRDAIDHHQLRINFNVVELLKKLSEFSSRRFFTLSMCNDRKFIFRITTMLSLLFAQN